MKKVFESIGNEIAILEKNFEFICERNNEKDVIVLSDLKDAISRLSKEFDLQLYKLAMFKNSIFTVSCYYKFELNDEFLDERNAVLEHIEYVIANYDLSERGSFSKNSENLDKKNLSLSVNNLKQYGTRLYNLDLKLFKFKRMLSENLEN